ncbi:MAG: HlyD family secretion protein [Pseudomonadota bacterium]|nr:HlyD family secretion protein [Pseudomonadota bacterium]
MAVQFSRTLRVLRADPSNIFPLVVASALGLIFIWGAWLVFGAVAMHVVSDSARLESSVPSHRIHSVSGGTVARVHATLGERVREGDLIVELDTTAERRQLRQEDGRIRAFEAKLLATREKLESERLVIRADDSAAGAELARANAQREIATTQVRQAADDVARLRRLGADSLVSKAEMERAGIELLRTKAVVDAAESEVRRLTFSGIAGRGRGDTSVSQGQSEIADVETELAESRSRREVLLRAIEDRLIRASTQGVLAELQMLRPGTSLGPGEYLGAIIGHEDGLMVVAHFPPDAALGRIRPGQNAKVRLDSFPWMRFGSLDAKVQRASAETHSGTVRVELSIEDTSGIPVQHGLTGKVEIGVERITPLDFIVRTSGQKLIGAGAPSRETGPGPTP